MDVHKLIDWVRSDDAPFNHQEFTVALHNRVIEEIRAELWQFREKKAMDIKSSYAACNHIFDLPSMQIIK